MCGGFTCTLRAYYYEYSLIGAAWDALTRPGYAYIHPRCTVRLEAASFAGAEMGALRAPTRLSALFGHILAKFAASRRFG